MYQPPWYGLMQVDEVVLDLSDQRVGVECGFFSSQLKEKAVCFII